MVSLPVILEGSITKSIYHIRTQIIFVQYCRNGPRAESMSGQEVRKFDQELTKKNFYAILGMNEMPEM